MTEQSAELYGRGKVLRFVADGLDRSRDRDTPPVVLLIGSRGSGMTMLLDRIEARHRTGSPTARLDFGRNPDASPAAVMLDIGSLLSPGVARVGKVRFPLLAMGSSPSAWTRKARPPPPSNSSSGSATGSGCRAERWGSWPGRRAPCCHRGSRRRLSQRSLPFSAGLSTASADGGSTSTWPGTRAPSAAATTARDLARCCASMNGGAMRSPTAMRTPAAPRAATSGRRYARRCSPTCEPVSTSSA